MKMKWGWEKAGEEKHIQGVTGKLPGGTEEATACPVALMEIPCGPKQTHE